MTTLCVAVPLGMLAALRAYSISQLRISREYDALKAALFQGGVTAETIDLLIAGAHTTDGRKDSHADDPKYSPPLESGPGWKPNGNTSGTHSAHGGGYSNGCSNSRRPSQQHGFQRQVSYGFHGLDDPGTDDYEASLNGDGTGHRNFSGKQGDQNSTARTLYFSGLSDRTTLRDLLSVIKGGKLLSINMRGGSATVSFHSGAAEFLAWAKRNDLYLQAKRIEVKWADRQFRLNGHVGDKIALGATRNLVIRHAVDRGLTEEQIRDDMEHIHNLAIIDVTFRQGDAFVCTNAIHNALYARTCMMSRSTYRGCKVEFFPDECDVPLPQRKVTPQYNATHAGATRPKAHAPPINRFNLLNMDGTEASSDEENQTPSEHISDDLQTIDHDASHGVRLDFFDS